RRCSRNRGPPRLAAGLWRMITSTSSTVRTITNSKNSKNSRLRNPRINSTMDDHESKPERPKPESDWTPPPQDIAEIHSPASLVSLCSALLVDIGNVVRRAGELVGLAAEQARRNEELVL